MALSPSVRASRWLLLLGFAAALLLPPLTWLADLRRGAQTLDAEGRYARPLPPLPIDAASLATFPAAFEAHYRDGFGLRGPLFALDALAHVYGLGVAPIPSVIVGRDGWLFFADDLEWAGYRGTRRYDPRGVRGFVDLLAARQAFLAERSIAYLLVLIPNKTTVYAEELPPELTRVAGGPLDQLVAEVRRFPAIELLDLRPAMARARASERIYDRTDSHWNGRGAFVAYQEILSKLSARFPALSALPRSAFEDVRQPGQPGGDLARMLWLERWLPEEVLTLRPRIPRRAVASDASRFLPESGSPIEWAAPLERKVDDDRLPQALVLRDSFTIMLEPFLSEHFRRVDYLFTDDLDAAVIERERPDLVVEIMIERRLVGEVPPLNRDFPRARSKAAAKDSARAPR